MQQRARFFHKLLSRIDRISREEIQTHVLELARECDEYRSVLEKVPAGVLLVSGNAQASFVNAQARAWLGLPAGSAAQKENFTGLISDARLAAYLRKNLTGEILPGVEEFRLVEPRELDLRVFIYPLEPQDDFQDRAMVLLVNVSAEKSREAEHARLQRNESLVRLASGVAHEIGNPLNSIHIHLELLKKEADKLSASSRDLFLGKIRVLKDETTRLDRIVRNFLKATRKPPLRFRLENLNELIREAVDFYAPELAGHHISVAFRQDRRLPPFLMDRERIREVFINLIKNAMEAMPVGGKILISVTSKGKAVMIRVRDHGQGIREEDLPHIFDAYFTTKNEGSGLGLMMVYDAIAEHGGRIEVDSKAGKGTTFTLLLPVRTPKLQLPAQ